jgi:hypothetical protein
MMRGGKVLIGIALMVAYAVGRPSSGASVPFLTLPPTVLAQVAVPAPNSSNPPPAAKADLSDKPARTDNNGKVDPAMTAVAIAAIVVIIIKASRDQYHATGKPCACPDERARDGSTCGLRSAYSRRGGAPPFCYPTDVTPEMIEHHRQTPR